MPKTTEATVPTFDIEVYKTNSEALNQGSAMTLIVAAQGLLERGVQTDDEYRACVQMKIDAAGWEKKHLDNFDPLCKGLNSLHKMATKLRGQYSEPWSKLAEKLHLAARKWYLEVEAAKERYQEQLRRDTEKTQQEIALSAQDLIDQGFVREGRARLLEAQAVTAPVLGDAIPQVEGARITPKLKATCTDLTAVLTEIVAGRMDLMWEVKGEMRPLVALDQAVLNAIVSRMGMALKCPGLKVEKDVSIGATKL